MTQQPEPEDAGQVRRAPDDRAPDDRAPDDRGPGQVLFEFVRHWSRRTGGEQQADRGRLVVVVEAVHSLAARTSPTINAVAHEIGIDQSGASRLVKDAVAGGYLELTASRADARRREVVVTAAGRRMLRDAHRWQESVFEDLTAGWSDRRRDDFRRAMLDLVARSHTLGGELRR